MSLLIAKFNDALQELEAGIEELDGLEGRTVLVLGAGEMAEGTVKSLAAAGSRSRRSCMASAARAARLAWSATRPGAPKMAMTASPGSDHPCPPAATTRYCRDPSLSR